LAATEGLVASAHDVSSGGLLVALAESCVAGDVGVEVSLPDDVPTVQALFSESPGRVVVSLASTDVLAFARLCADAEVPVFDLGTVAGDRLAIDRVVDLDLDDLVEASNGLTRLLEH
ncbi:MAG: AIR synthase-related protein, partial [Nitriliruptoraceae bacterium]